MVLRNYWNESHSIMSNSLWPHGLYSPWNSPGQNTGMGSPSPFPGDLSNPGMEPRSPAIQGDSAPAEPPGRSESLLNLRSTLTQGCITVSRAAAYRAHLGFMGSIWSRQARGQAQKRMVPWSPESFLYVNPTSLELIFFFLSRKKKKLWVFLERS